MMPYDTYRLHQVERAKSPGEIRRADEQAARFASALSRLIRGFTLPALAGRRPHLAAGSDGVPRMAEPAGCGGTMTVVIKAEAPC